MGMAVSRHEIRSLKLPLLFIDKVFLTFVHPCIAPAGQKCFRKGGVGFIFV